MKSGRDGYQSPQPLVNESDETLDAEPLLFGLEMNLTARGATTADLTDDEEVPCHQAFRDRGELSLRILG
jgi:hypothetical protein